MTKKNIKFVNNTGEDITDLMPFLNELYDADIRNVALVDYHIEKLTGYNPDGSDRIIISKSGVRNER
jgi:hypothetical protein